MKFHELTTFKKIVLVVIAAIGIVLGSMVMKNGIHDIANHRGEPLFGVTQQ